MKRNLTLVEREPVAIRAVVVALVTAVVHVGVVAGVVDKDLEMALVPVIDLAGVLIAILWARRGATANAKVITRVNTDGEVVAGDASTVPTGATVAVRDRHTGEPVVTPVPVDPELVQRAA